MSTFEQRIEVGASETGPFVQVVAVVDTGAFYTLIPKPVLEQLGVSPRSRRQFVLADGRTIERQTAIITVKFDGEVQPTICVIGESGTIPLLGAVTLEEFALAADPVNRRLIPIPRLYLLSAAAAAS